MIFVTALINIQETRDDRGLEMRLAMFQKLANTGIRLHVFIDPEYADRVHVPNGVVVPVDFSSLETVKTAPSGLPTHRLECKDTRGFMLLMNAKLEFVKMCMDTTTASHYAWIDFSIFHVLTDSAALQLKSISTRWFPSQCLYFPGCIGPGVMWDRINWRFCGGFFLGDRDSLYSLYDRYIQTFPTLPNLCWEVNVWAYLEHLGQTFDWFSGNHDNSILAIPAKAVTIPPNLDVMWSSPDLMFRVRGSIYNFIVATAAPYALTPLFYKADGVFADDEYDDMIASLGREDHATIPGRTYTALEQFALKDTKALMCTHITRWFTAPSVLLVPWDDGMFDAGVAKYDFSERDWSERRNVAVWRGGSSGLYRPSLRMRLVEALDGVAGTDVKFVRGGWPVNDAVIPDAHFGNAMTKYEQAAAKYIFVVDGNGPASNAQWVFASGAVPIFVTHPGNKWWFQSEMISMVNYVSVQWDLSDLSDKLAWLRNNDAAAHEIALQAAMLGKRMFSPENQRSYLRQQIQNHA